MLACDEGAGAAGAGAGGQRCQVAFALCGWSLPARCAGGIIGFGTYKTWCKCHHIIV